MTSFLSSLDLLLFAVLPYVAVVTFVTAAIARYTCRPYSVTSLSAQFLETKQHFWGSVPFHYGIMGVLTGHLVGFFIPKTLLLWNSHPIRLYVLEITGFALATLALFGMINMIARRINDPKSRVVTSITDWMLFTLIVIQICTGIFTALFHGWGSSWFASSASPYLWSLVKLSPDISYIAPMPWMVKVHVAGAFLMIGIIPRTRLMHFLVAPIPYLWRKPQIVRWYADRSKR